jgi:uncharacterized protein (DUF983 family)
VKAALPEPFPGDGNGVAALAWAALRLRCPICKGARIFPTWFRMATSCPACATKLEREEGYYLGSMYLGYGLTMAAGLLIFSIGVFALGVSPSVMIGVYVVFAILFPLFSWRYARAAWMAVDQFLDPRTPPGRGAHGGENAGAAAAQEESSSHRHPGGG